MGRTADREALEKVVSRGRALISFEKRCTRAVCNRLCETASFDENSSFYGQIVCGVRIISALTASSDPWYLGDVAWELVNPVPYARGLAAKGSLGVWVVSEEVRVKFERARERK